MRAPVMLLAVASILAGCASLSETECQARNWDDIGHEDGTEGRQPERIEDHTEACAEHGVTPDRDAWEGGYNRGLEVYCTPENAVDVGLSGGRYTGVCPPESDAEFASHWRVARAVYEQRQRIEELERRRRELEYLWDRADTEQERYNVRNEIARVDRQLLIEQDRLFLEQRRLDDFLRGVR